MVFIVNSENVVYRGAINVSEMNDSVEVNSRPAQPDHAVQSRSFKVIQRSLMTQ